MSAQQIQEAVDAIQAQAVAPEAEPEVMDTPQEDSTNESQEQTDVDIDLSTSEQEDKGEALAVDMPSSWSKDKADIWNELTPEAQQIVADREGNIQSDYSRKLDETAAERKKIESDREAVSKQKADLLDRMKTYGPKKPSEDLLDPNSDNYDPDQYHLANAQYKKATAKMEEVEAEISLEEAQKLKTWQEQEIKVYQQILPEFVDPEKGPAYRRDLAEYAVKTLGITMQDAAERFPTTAAAEMLLMDKARKYDAAVAKAKSARSKPKPKTLSAGNSNPVPANKSDKKSAAAKYNKDRSPQAAANYLASFKKQG